VPKIIVRPHAVLCPEGKTFEAQSGVSVCENLLDHDIEIEHACEMSCACTTCHVVIRKGYSSLNEPKEKEEDLLDMAWGLEATSRLSCQAIVDEDDLEIEIPKYTINHARENH
jgi:2Fe-2S ferredoxin